MASYFNSLPRGPKGFTWWRWGAVSPRPKWLYKNIYKRSLPLCSSVLIW